ncbi:sulfite exporter TauE/SafE family protein [Mesobacillus harenae]|uniref:urease accessory protein UreH domain-containing protein n=1 Tax=Mesobacillus harenae TaxID=2213203 RepID=UPI0015803484|nr:sulfite exporter TauE/SafE family protein [Mesobacillus harenae]
MYQLLNELSQFLSRPFFSIIYEIKELPLLASFVLGLIGALAPCQLTGNIGAITYYGNKSLQASNQWIHVGFFILGKIAVFSALGLAVWSLGQSFQQVLPEYFSGFRKVIGPMFILIGAVLLGFLKLNWINSVSALLPQVSKEGKLGSFLMGVSFSIAFCPTMFSLFFLTLMPIVLSSSYGAILPTIFAVGTSIPVILLIGVIWFIGLDGSLMKKSKEIGSVIQKTAGIILILIGIFDIITYW